MMQMKNMHLFPLMFTFYSQSPRMDATGLSNQLPVQSTLSKRLLCALSTTNM